MSTLRLPTWATSIQGHADMKYCSKHSNGCRYRLGRHGSPLTVPPKYEYDVQEERVTRIATRMYWLGLIAALVFRDGWPFLFSGSMLQAAQIIGIAILAATGEIHRYQAESRLQYHQKHEPTQ